MSRLERRRKAAARRGAYAFCYPVSFNWPGWDVCVEREGALGPRGLCLTKRQAVNLAYAIAVSKRAKMTVTYTL